MGNDKKEEEEDRKEEKASEVPQSPGEKGSVVPESAGEKGSEVPQSPGEKAGEVPQSPGEKDSAVPQFHSSSSSPLSSSFFEELLDSVIVDVASECHRIARLGLDHHLDDAEEELRLSEEAWAWVADPSNAEEANRKRVVDVFGNTHPAVANEIVECMHCGRSVVAGIFARHLDRCRKKRKRPQNRDSSEIMQSKLSSTSHAATASSTSHAESRTASGSKEANTRCGCPVSRCKSGNCKCKKAGVPCSSDCGCKNCENGKNNQPPSTTNAAIASGLDAGL